MTYQDAYHRDHLVQAMARAGRSLEEIIGAMAERHLLMSKALIEAQSIAPRKMVLQDGTAYVWHCPNELIPPSK